MDGSADNGGARGGEGVTIEADETRVGTKKPEEWRFVNDVGWVKIRRREQMLVMTLVERGGRAGSVKVEDLTKESLRNVLVVNASRKSALHTAELSPNGGPGRDF